MVRWLDPHHFSRLIISLMMVLGNGLATQAQPTAMYNKFYEVLNSYEPLVPPDASGFRTPPMYSNMRYAIQHDARWLLAGGSHVVGSVSRTSSLSSNGAEVFAKIGNSFQDILRYYAEYEKAREMVGMVKSMWEYVQNYRLRVNLYKLIPNLIIAEPGDPFGPHARYYVIGFCPKHDQTWKATSELFGDNPYYKPKGSLRLIEVRYPRSWADIKIDSSIWGGDSLDSLEFQKRAMAGFYDGVVSAGRYLTNVGVDNTMESSVGRLSPKNLASQAAQLIDKRIVALQRQRSLYDDALANPHGDVGKMYASYAPEDLVRLQQGIDAEIARLETKKQMALGNEIVKQQPWVERANFIHQILAKLEAPERRIAIARLSERFKKYENAWVNPAFMVKQPDITGDPRVDNAIYLIWEALTVLSAGKIPPPEPVSGGKAAETQATLVKSMYRHFTYEELTAIRQLLAQDFQITKQKEGAAIVEDAKADIARHIQIIQMNAERLKQWKAMNALKTTLATEPAFAWAKSLSGW